MNIEKTKIIADSSSDVLSLNEIPFGNAPLKIVTDTKEYTDNEHLNVKQMVEDLRVYKGKSSTSCPNPSDWLESFGNAENVFCITITAALSGSYNSACIAKATYEETHPDRRVYVINSRSTGPEMYLIIEKLTELIKEGLDFDTVCQKIVEYQNSTGLIFILQSMINLANNGRVSHIAAKMAGFLGIRAIGKASEQGTLEMLEKCRGENKTAEEIVKQLKLNGYRGGKIRLSHCLAEAFAEKMREIIVDEFSPSDIKVYSCRGLCSFYAESGGLLVGFEKE